MRWSSRNRSKAQSRRFHDAMVGVYERVSAACPGYWPTAVLAMVRGRGGFDGRARATGSGTGRLGGAGERRRGESTFARGARGETNLPWLEAYDRVGPGFLVQQPCATEAVPWQKICGRRGREDAQLALVLHIRDILYPQPQSRGGFTHDPSGNHPHLG